jgi:hypothetical protein
MTDGQITGFWVGYAIVVVVGLAVHILLSHAIGKAAERRNRSYWAFFWLSFFVSWIIMGIIVATLPKPPSASGNPSPEDPVRLPGETAGAGSAYSLTEQSETVACPFCAEEIKAKADICRFCNRDVSKQRKEREASEEKARKSREAAALAAEAREEERRAALLAEIEIDRTRAVEQERQERASRREKRVLFWKSRRGISLGAILAFVLVVLVAFPFIVSAAQSQAHLRWESRLSLCGKPPKGLAGLSASNSGELSFVVQNTRGLSETQVQFITCIGAQVIELKAEDLGQAIKNFVEDYSGVQDRAAYVSDSGRRQILTIAWHRSSSVKEKLIAVKVTVKAGKDYSSNW